MLLRPGPQRRDAAAAEVWGGPLGLGHRRGRRRWQTQLGRRLLVAAARQAAGVVATDVLQLLGRLHRFAMHACGRGDGLGQ